MDLINIKTLLYITENLPLCLYWFVFEQNSGREITWLSWRHRFIKRAHYHIKPVDKTKLSCNTPHWRRTTVSLETYPLYSLNNGPVSENCHEFRLTIYSVQQTHFMTNDSKILHDFISEQIYTHCNYSRSLLDAYVTDKDKLEKLGLLST